MLIMLRENKAFRFYEQVKQEVYKVTWPDKRDLIVSTGIVIATVFFCGLICLMLDYIIHNLIQMLLNI